MAVIVEERPEVTEDTSDLPSSAAPQEPEQEQASSVPEVPEKYKGKQLTDLVQMHQEAEKLMGRQGSEIGELRRVVDDFITKQTQLGSKTPEPVQEIDFFVDPQKAVLQQIENHPAIKEAREAAQVNRKTTALNTLKAKHPDAETVVTDQAFGEWVQQSPIRLELLRRADQQFDVSAADELFSSYKERKSLLSKTVQQDQNSRKASVRQGSTSPGDISSEAPSKKVYRRADIIKLMAEDPERYTALGDEILKAYSEGRVR